MRSAAGAVLGLILAGLTWGCAWVGRGPLTVWFVSEGAELLPDSPPMLENDVYSASRRTVRLTAAGNETVGVQLAARAATPLTPLELEIGELSGPQGRSIPRSAIRVWREHWVRVEEFRSWYPLHTGRAALPRLVADVLVPWESPRGGGPLRLEPQRTEALWIEVRVPPGVPGGVYAGRIELVHPASPTLPRAVAYSGVLEVAVARAAIPPEVSFPVIARVDPTDLLYEHLNWPRGAPQSMLLVRDEPAHRPAVALCDAIMRLLHEHRLNPVLWACFPKFRLRDARTVEMEWDVYDRLVQGWISGAAFEDGVGAIWWPIPADLHYPDAERNGGFESPQYARLLAAYVAECRRHYAERGWADRCFVRLVAPEPLGPAGVERVRRAARIARQSEADLPLVVHLPAESLRGLGWFNCPAIDVPEAGIWCPPAGWFEPLAMQRVQAGGRRAWFMPDVPPYSGSLALEAPPVDARMLSWQAYARGAEALWIEHATRLERASPEVRGVDRSGAGLLYSGKPFGLDGPLPSVRLKRLQRGVQDYELLRLVEKSGRELLARRTAEQVVRWAFTEACGENLLTTRGSGWSLDPNVLERARRLLLDEFGEQESVDSGARARQMVRLAEWARTMEHGERVQAAVTGVRIVSEPSLRAVVFVAISNLTDVPVGGRCAVEAPPSWRAPPPQPVTVPSRATQTLQIPLEVPGLVWNSEGVCPLGVTFQTDSLGSYESRARLAVAACPLIDYALHPDGDLSDWPRAADNALGDFRLVRPAQPESRDGSPSGTAGMDDRPALPTHAMVATDGQTLYVAVRCVLNPHEPPRWVSDNTVPVEGAIPWGQDLVEVLIQPRGGPDAPPGDIFVLQVKPGGVLVATRGPRTEPPIALSEPWVCGARVASRIEPESWTVELALPVSSLGPHALRDKVWGFNVTRLDSRRGQYSSWSGARGHCYQPRGLGNLLLRSP